MSIIFISSDIFLTPLYPSSTPPDKDLTIFSLHLELFFLTVLSLLSSFKLFLLWLSGILIRTNLLHLTNFVNLKPPAVYIFSILHAGFLAHSSSSTNLSKSSTQRFFIIASVALYPQQFLLLIAVSLTAATAIGRNGSKEINAHFVMYYFRIENTLIPS